MGFTPVTECVWNVQMFPSGNREPIGSHTSALRGGLNVLSSPIHKIPNKHTHRAQGAARALGMWLPAVGMETQGLLELRKVLGWDGPRGVPQWALTQCHMFLFSGRIVRTLADWVQIRWLGTT